MAITLEKGQRINLEKGGGAKLTNFCVGCKWGNVEKKSFFGLITNNVDVDLDLSCLMFDAQGECADYIYSDLFKFADLGVGIPNGKLVSVDGAIRHTGDALQGGPGVDDEVITVDLLRVDPKINSIVFFLNIYNNNDYQGDFSGIPYARIRMYEYDRRPENVKSVFAEYNITTRTDCAGKRGIVMAKLYRHNGEWKFAAIGDAFEDRSIVLTIARVAKDYSK
ncbi:MAG: TerD family protein [Bacteroidaceae bacterium]|nr:TerD family protein [Bacteroidaceae bacterium]